MVAYFVRQDFNSSISTYLRQGWRRYTCKTVLGTCIFCALLRVCAFATATAEHATANRTASSLRWAANGRLGRSDSGFSCTTLDLLQSRASVGKIYRTMQFLFSF